VPHQVNRPEDNSTEQSQDSDLLGVPLGVNCFIFFANIYILLSTPGVYEETWVVTLLRLIVLSLIEQFAQNFRHGSLTFLDHRGLRLGCSVVRKVCGDFRINHCDKFDNSSLDILHLFQ
jgi:hypothetical protein